MDVAVAMLEEIVEENQEQHNYIVGHVFSSESCTAARSIIQHNFHPRHMFSDLTKRALFASDSSGRLRPAASELNNLDIYVAGFPCQPFSTAGLRKGVNDKDGRGLIWTHIIQFIIVAKPKCVILENVVGFTQGEHKLSFAQMLTFLEETGSYALQWRILNTRDYGVAQNRERVYVVGLRHDSCQLGFKWPDKTAASSSPSLDAFLDRVTGVADLTTLPTAPVARSKCVAALNRLIEQGHDPRTTPAVCSINNRCASTMINCSPCLTARRASEHGHWLLHRARYMSESELFRLQGLQPERWQCPPDVGQHQLKACIGNAMSGNVIKCLLNAALRSLGRL